MRRLPENAAVVVSARAAPRSGAACATCCRARAWPGRARRRASGTSPMTAPPRISPNCSPPGGRSSGLCERHIDPHPRPVDRRQGRGTAGRRRGRGRLGGGALLGGHRGANAIARHLADALGGVAAITTAGDCGSALRSTSRRRLASRRPGAGQDRRGGAARRASGRAARRYRCRRLAARWRRKLGRKRRSDRAGHRPRNAADPRRLVFHPPVLALGMAASAAAMPARSRRSAHATLDRPGSALCGCGGGLGRAEDGRAGDPCPADALGAPARFFAAERCSTRPAPDRRSEAAFRATGCWGWPRRRACRRRTGRDLLVAKQKVAPCDLCRRRASAPIEATAIALRGAGSRSSGSVRRIPPGARRKRRD